MLTVHHLGVSQSDRIVWLCEELGLEYELKRYDRLPESRRSPPELRKLTYYGAAPVITDGDFVLGESGAIVEYITNIYAGGRMSVRPGEPNYADYLFWLHFANASLNPSMLMSIVNDGTMRPAQMAVRVDSCYAQMEARLGEVPYFAGQELTGADIMMVFPMTTLRLTCPRDLAPYPNIRAYLQRIGARPAFRRAMAKADPDFQPVLT